MVEADCPWAHRALEAGCRWHSGHPIWLHPLLMTLKSKVGKDEGEVPLHSALRPLPPTRLSCLLGGAEASSEVTGE